MKAIGRVAPTLGVVVGIVMAWAAWHHYATHYLHPAHAPDEEAVADQTERVKVEISPEKLAAAKIETQVIEPKAERLAVIVPGRLAYDSAQLVSVRLGSAGILTKVLVQPGQAIEAKQVVAVMSSPEVGSARADQLQRAAELELAKRQANWDKSRAESVRKLVAAIKQQKSAEEIRLAFTDQSIGDAREKLLTAYSELNLAASLSSRMAAIATSGAVSTRTVDERKMQLASSQAALQAVIEQTVFDVDRAASAAQIALDDSQRRYEIASGRVKTLLGLSGALEPTPLVPVVSASSPLPDIAQPESLADLSVIEIRAPRAGTVEKRLFNENERVEAGSVLLEIADTSRLWLKADIRESQWTALGLKAGQEINWSSPALPGEQLNATIVMMGREVDPQTNAISLVASVENAYGRLRPGMYVKAELPMGETSSSIVVPESALSIHEGQSFVFVTTDDRTFERRDVRTGQRSPNKVEIIAGLSAGEKIAVSGVFHLKSELLLEKEE